MKNLKNIYLWGISLLMVCLVSCKEESDQDSTPIQINQIYLEDYKSEVPDRAVDFVRLGQLIRIEGSGLLGMKKVYINGYDTYFNVAYVADHSMLLTVNSKTPVVEASDDVRNTIRFVKSGAEVTYPFTVRSAAPYVTHLSNTLPQPGERVIVYGDNLQETTKVTLPGGTVITDIESGYEGEWYAFTMPSGVTGSGSILSEGANGMAATPEYFNFTECMILNFDGVGVSGAWGWSETGSMIGATDSDSQKREMVQDPLNSGRGECVQLIPDRLLTNAAGGIVAGKSRATECWTSGTGEPTDNWERMYSYIPAETPLTEVAFQFDIYVPEFWGVTGQIQVALYNNFNFSGVSSDEKSGRTAFYIPYVEEGEIVPFRNSGWQTVTIPFSEFGYYAKLLEDKEATPPTFQMVVEDRLAATYQNFGMGITNTDFTYKGVSVTATTMNQKIYLDNWRVVPCASIEVSDFED